MTDDPSGHPMPIHLQTRFERFPLSIRGAFVFRGADRNPHAVRVTGATLARIPAGITRAVPVEDRLIDVAPARDLFVPFEVSVADLESGWYRVESSVRVDGGRTYHFAGRPFTMPWPRTDVRRGTIVVGKTVTAGGYRFLVERVDLKQDCTVVSWRPLGEPAPPEPPPDDSEDAIPPGGATLLADGRDLEVLPLEAAGPSGARPPAAGDARTVGYPVPSRCRSLAVVIAAPSGQRSPPLALKLP